MLGLITLLVFPLPTFIIFYFVEGVDPIDILELENLSFFNLVIGAELGVAYAFFSLILLQCRVFDEMPNRVEKLVRDMKLTLFDCFFLSVCAGVGEELLFRSGVQFYLGPVITSVVFVAIHGYLNPFNWRMSLYGLIVLPFIFLISYGFEYYGLWFAISAHFAYDLVLFITISRRH